MPPGRGCGTVAAVGTVVVAAACGVTACGVTAWDDDGVDAGGTVGATAEGAGWQAASTAVVAATPKRPRARRRVTGAGTTRIAPLCICKPSPARQDMSARAGRSIGAGYAGISIGDGTCAVRSGHNLWEAMKASFFVSLPYGRTSEATGKWPVANRLFEPEHAIQVLSSRMDHVQLADELGFDWIGCAEHHYSPGSLASNVSAVAAAITQRSHRARICIMGALLPLNNPVRVAEEYALVDAMSGGRLVAGLLRGAPYEYLVYNVPPAESRSRFEEAWELVVRAWTDTEPFGWEGEHYHYRYVSIWPRPVQQPLPPIFISGASRESAEFAARRRIGLGLAFTNLAAARPAAQHYFQQAAQ